MPKIKRLLLVDDDPVANFVHEDIITSLGLFNDIQIANNGEEALTVLSEKYTEKEFPQMILLDLNMPVMDGFDFIKNIRNIFPGIASSTKIVVLSSSSNNKDLEMAKNLRVDGYIEKPLTDEKIQVMIKDQFKEKAV